MSEQYFKPEPSSLSKRESYRFDFGSQDFLVQTDAGVFSREGLDQGSKLMLLTVLPDLHGRVLDLGCGWGAVGLIAGKLKPNLQLLLVDVNQRACGLAIDNLRNNGVNGQVVCTDGFRGIHSRFDWILLNPPIRAGKQVVYRLFRDSAAHLLPGGRLVVVIRKQQGAPSAKAYLETIFGRVDLAARSKGYHVLICGEPLEERIEDGLEGI